MILNLRTLIIPHSHQLNNFKLCLTKQLLNMFKLWCERGIIKTTPHVCRLYKGDRVLSVCSQFKAMSPGGRLCFVRGKKLCFCLFVGRHVVRQCRAGVICGVEGCTSKRSKLVWKGELW